MAKVVVYKASAGSGKTYRLTQDYLGYLMSSQDQDAYKHVLAVTFTNKATDEMKVRVLETLAEEAQHSEKAKETLIKILHDYSNFFITTIDKFFLQVLRSFAREIGQNSSYKVELDEQAVIAKAVDQMFDSLEDENKSELLGWMLRYSTDSIKKGSSFDIAKDLCQLGSLFLDEDFRIKRVQLKGSFIQDSITIQRTQDELLQRIADFEAEFPDIKKADSFRKRQYRTDLVLADSIMIMGIFNELYSNLTEYLHDNNLVLLSESKDTIRKIIDNNDAPFIYEKVGNRFDHIMLDEFQDTSQVEWQNFLPLYKECLSKGNDCLIVGDIKQSIYRFRGSDWETLDKGLDKDFDANAINHKTLTISRRSAKQIVTFNNLLYGQIASWMPDEYSSKISELYNDAEQQFHKQNEGFVSVKLCKNVDEETFHDLSMKWMLEAIEELKTKHYPLSSITILCRTNSQVSNVAQKLIENNYDVITDDSLLISSCRQVQRIVVILKYLVETSDDILYKQIEILGGILPDIQLTSSSLYNLSEQIIRDYLGIIDKGDIPYINAFLDIVSEYVSSYGSNTADFVDWWDNTASKCKYISVPDGQEAVRIMTYHKSKGLSLDAVIIPFFIENFSPRHTKYIWVNPDKTVCPIPLFPVKCTQAALKSTFFEENYNQEKFLDVVDASNVAYVATTRAKQSMYIFGRSKSKSILSMADCLGKMLDNQSNNIFELNYQQCDFGVLEEYIEEQESSNAAKQESVDLFVSIPFDLPHETQSGKQKKRLDMAPTAADFFLNAGNRQRGVVLHDILSQVNTIDDLPAAVNAAVSEGALPMLETNSVNEKLKSAINSVGHYHWFDSTNEVYTEATIVNEYGISYRPDRIIISGEEVSVIDYKFGEENAKYKDQVNNYLSLLQNMGFRSPRGYIWYVEDDSIVEV